jgi:hypothetical protein
VSRPGSVLEEATVISRSVRAALAAPLLVFALPGIALAENARFSPASFGVHLVVSLIGLVVAVVLLVGALGVRKLAHGGVVAERISLVMLAAICLAASALAQWGTSFVVDLTLDQTQLASEVLVTVAMALLALYFWNVRTVMQGYIKDSGSFASGDDPQSPEAGASQEADRG